MDEIIQHVLICIKKVKDELGDFYKENIYQPLDSFQEANGFKRQFFLFLNQS